MEAEVEAIISVPLRGQLSPRGVHVAKATQLVNDTARISTQAFIIY